MQLHICLYFFLFWIFCSVELSMLVSVLYSLQHEWNRHVNLRITWFNVLPISFYNWANNKGFKFIQGHDQGNISPIWAKLHLKMGNSWRDSPTRNFPPLLIWLFGIQSYGQGGGKKCSLHSTALPCDQCSM